MKIQLDHKKDKELLENLLEALDVAENKLRRDELNYWNIYGKYGYIDTDSVEWYLRLTFDTKRQASACKRALCFMGFQLDLDTYLCLKLDRMPNEEESSKIRLYGGFHKRPELDENTRLDRSLKMKEIRNY